MNDKKTGNSFTPYSIIPMPQRPQPRPAWQTPDFNPNVADNNYWNQIAQALSPQTQAGLEQLRRQMQPQQQTVVPTTPQTMRAIPQDYIQLPNGQFVSPEQYKQLQLRLQQRR